MPKNTHAKTALPQGSQELLCALGERVRLARRRRGMTLRELAARMLVSVKTLRRLENGDSGVSLGVLMTALMCMGLEQNMEHVAAMETDGVGMAHERRRLMARRRVRAPGRAGKAATPAAEFDF